MNDLYPRYRALSTDLSPLGLTPGEATPYYCTPVGAEIIGWAGVDGIHYCFIPGFGDMVFVVSPEDYGGQHVRPLAKTFADFLGLVLSAHGTNTLEQISRFDRETYDAFVTSPEETEYAQSVPVVAALDAIRSLGVAPISDPFQYVKALQADFDYNRIPCTAE